MKKELQEKYASIPDTAKLTIKSSLTNEQYTNEFLTIRNFVDSQSKVQKQLEKGTTSEVFKFSVVFDKFVEVLDNIVEQTDTTALFNQYNLQQSLTRTFQQIQGMSSQNQVITFEFVTSQYANYDEYLKGFTLYHETDKINEFKQFINIIQVPANVLASNLLNQPDRSGAIISYLGITLKDKKYLTPQSLSKAKEEAYRSEIDKLTEELTQSNQNLTDFVKEKLAETQSEFSSQTEEFNNQYQDITTLAQEQLGKTQEEFNNLKAAYEQQLSFEAPITHWNEQSTNRAKLAIFWAIGAVVEVIVIIVLAGWLLHNLYSGQYKVASDIPQYFVPIALISILVYVLRVCINIAVSNWHMSSEYSQKAALTTYYLSMLKEGHISEGEKAYVLPALFAKIDTGLNKYQSESDDSSIMSLINSVRNGAGK